MGSEWKEFSLEELVSDQKAALATGPFGSAISSKFFQESGIPVIRGGNLSANISERMSDKGLVFISEEKASEFKRSLVKKDDLIFTCWGTINQVGLLDEQRDYSEYIISNKQMKVTLDSNKADPLFVYYIFSAPKKQKEIIKNGIGAAVPGFNLGQLREHKLLLPGIEEQRNIASFLNCFDKKIALNRQINQTLEQMAQTLFKSWFVDFDPVIDNALDAIANGQNIEIPESLAKRFEARKAVRESEGFEPLPADIRQLFPCEFEKSELGFVPKGWSWYTFQQVCTAKQGKYISKNHMVDIQDSENMIPVWGGNGVRGYTKESLYNESVVVLTCRGSNCGLLGKTISKTWVSNISFACTPKLGSINFLHLLFDYTDFSDCISGSAQPQITYSALKNKSIPAALNDHVIERFDEIIRGFYSSKERIFSENKELTKLRDTLLPKLISGELRLDSPQGEALQQAVSVE